VVEGDFISGESFSPLSEAIRDFYEKFLHFIKKVVRIWKFKKAAKYYKLLYLKA